MTNPLPMDVADKYAVDRIREVLSSHLAGRLDTVWSRDADNYATDGLYLPDPEAVYGKSRPGLEEILETNNVALVAGAADDSESVGMWTGGSGGDLDWRLRLYGVRVLVRRHRGQPQDTVENRKKRRDTTVVERCKRYTASAKWVLAAYLHQTGRGGDGSKMERAIKRVQDIDRDTVDSYELPKGVNSGVGDIFAAGSVRVRAISEVERPQRSATP